MICTFLLILSSIVCFFHLNYTELQPERMEFPDNIRQLCPHSTFCDSQTNNSERDNQRFNPDKTIVPCCSSCSCSEDCGRKRNCCKEEYDIHKLDQNLGTICKQLQLQPGYPFYHIIDKCPNRSKVCQQKGPSKNGIYRPVYSNKNGMIYFNKECSQCHGQRNTTSFIPIVTCKQQEMSYFSSIIRRNSDANTYYDDCAVHFIPPDGIDLSTELCYPSMIRNCSKTVSYSDETESLCHRFNATFHTRRITYSNVFCLFCNIEIEYRSSTWKRNFEFCPAREMKSVFGNAHLSVILNNQFDIDSKREGVENIETRRHKWCWRAGNKISCRQLHCPEGKEYHRGACIQIAERWFFKRLRMIINLVPPDEHAYIAILGKTQSFEESNAYESSIDLDRPGFENWNLTLFYNLNIESRLVRYFVGVLTFKHRNILAEQFINHLSNSIRMPWKLMQNQTVTILQPSFHGFLKYVRLNRTTFVPRWYKAESFVKSLDQDIDAYSLNFLTGDNDILKQQQRRETMYLTKVFFCDLVELSETEYVVGTITIYLVHNGKILGDGEFIWVGNENGRYALRVCAHDLGERVFAGFRLVQVCEIGMLLCLIVSFISQPALV